MAKTLVVGTGEDSPVPFLRGILTRSLQDAGLSFNKAYKISSVVRDDLNDTDKIATFELRKRVAERVRQSYGEAAASRYLRISQISAPVMVRYEDGEVTPFSSGYHRHYLEAISLPYEEALVVTQRLNEQLKRDQVREVSAQALERLTYRLLSNDKEFGPAVARRYLLWTQFLRSGRPLILLLGGTAGCGKSTLATELANRLEIVRSQSTDGLREVMRMMLPERLLPVLHTSSFTAWQALPEWGRETDHDMLLAAGYRTQAELLAVPCEAVIQRTLKERVSMILEGVHVHPLLLDRIERNTGAIVVPIMIAVLKPNQLRSRIRGRGNQLPRRSSKRYLRYFDAIWRLQSYLLSEADRAKIVIIPNDDKEKAIQEIMRTIISHLAREFSGNPNEIFSNTAGDSETV